MYIVKNYKKRKNKKRSKSYQQIKQNLIRPILTNERLLHNPKRKIAEECLPASGEGGGREKGRKLEEIAAVMGGRPSRNCSSHAGSALQEQNGCSFLFMQESVTRFRFPVCNAVGIWLLFECPLFSNNNQFGYYSRTCFTRIHFSRLFFTDSGKDGLRGLIGVWVSNFCDPKYLG